MCWRESPTLIVVSGLPAAGKSTVGRIVAERLGVPLVDKDDVLEDLFDSDEISPARRDELSRRADELFLDEIARHPAAVAVSFWRRSESSTTSGTPIDRFPPEHSLIELWCDCPAEVALERFFSRTRHVAHRDQQRDRAATRDQLRRLSELGPLGVGRLVRVDTTTVLDDNAIIGHLFRRDDRRCG